jgi:hypothetical protein
MHHQALVQLLSRRRGHALALLVLLPRGQLALSVLVYAGTDTYAPGQILHLLARDLFLVGVADGVPARDLGEHAGDPVQEGLHGLGANHAVVGTVAGVGVGAEPGGAGGHLQRRLAVAIVIVPSPATFLGGQRQRQAR